MFILYPVIWFIQIFGLDPETFSFWIGALLINLYVGLLAILFTGLVSFSIVWGIHMVGSIISWL